MTEPAPDSHSIPYRPEIDGLRAISVIGVILFHFELGCPGGYVGVDVFFVISGFLITSILLREIEQDRFSLLNFWARRIRRILPAASLVVAVSLVAGLFILTPSALANLAKSSFAQSLMAANIFFWKDANYFTDAAELKPLLHTWSLSVEEQFYLILPLVLLVIARFFRRWLHVILALGLLVSFAISVYGMEHHPEATFYLLPTRAWELLFGSLAASVFRRPIGHATLANLLSLLGLLGILAPMFFYTHATPFPGLHALPPVAGTFLLLVANAHKPTVTGRLLAFRPLVFTGLISYSLYLWHWPLLSLSRHVLIERTLLTNGLLLALTFVLSFLSWKFVEIPFRRSHRLRIRRVVFPFALVSTLLLLLAAGALVREKGYERRFDDLTLSIIEDTTWTGSEFKEEIGDPIGRMTLGLASSAGSRPPDFVLWGDSHAMVLGPLVHDLATELRLHGLAFITPACPPVPGLWMPNEPWRAPRDILKHTEQRLAWIRQNEVKNVILVGRWAAMCGSHGGNFSPSRGSADPALLMVTDLEVPVPESMALTPTESTAALQRKLSKMRDALDESGTRIWILAQVPEITPTAPAHDFYLAHRFPFFNSNLPKSGTDPGTHAERQSLPLGTFRSVAGPELRVVDPAPHFFSDPGELSLYSDRALYRDDNHLTRAGVEHYLAPLLSQVFEQFAKEHVNESSR